MPRQHDLRESIRAAATSLIRDAFEDDMDLWLPHKFKLKTVGFSYGSTIVQGPQLHKYDDSIVDGITINTYGIHGCCFIRINPFEELHQHSRFEYANPAFPGDALRYIGYGLGLWMSWWDVFKEDGQLEGLL